MTAQAQNGRRFALIVCLVLWLVVWFVPAGLIIFHALGGNTTGSDAPDMAASSLLDTPPPWVQSPDSANRWLELAAHSLRLSLATIILAIPTALIAGLLLVRSRWTGINRVRQAWFFLIFLPLPITATAWLGALGNLGRSQAFGISTQPLISGWSAAALVHAVAVVPLLAWIFGAVMLRTDTDLESLAALDVTPIRAFFRSTFIQIRPAAWAAGLIVMVMTAGDMTVTDLVQERTFAEEAYLQAQMGDGLAAASRTALPAILVVTTLLMAWMCMNRNWLLQMGGIATGWQPHRDWMTGRWTQAGGLLMPVFSLIVWGMPVLALAWRAGRSGGRADLEIMPHWSIQALLHNLGDAWPDIAETLPATVVIGLVTSAFCVVAAWFSVECVGRSRWWSIVLLIGTAIGLATPGPVAGLAVAWTWMPVRAVYDSSAMIIMAQVFRLMPVAVLLLWPSVLFRDQELNDLLILDRPSFRDVFWQVSWPSMSPLLWAGFFILFALSIGELPASNLVAPPGVELFSVRLWALMHTGLESHLSAVVLMALLTMTGLAVLFLTIFNRVSRSKMR